MDQRKQNSTRWYLLGLAAVLLAGCMLVSVGTTYARYQINGERMIPFTPAISAQPALGILEESGFDPYGTIAWQELLLTEGEGEEIVTRKVYRMELALSNYLDMTGYDETDMLVYLRLVGSLDAFRGSEFGTLVLTDGTLLEDGTPRQIEATVTPIEADTTLYHDFGTGWVFRFLDDQGQELSWLLEGGALSCVQLQLTMDAAALNGTSLLQLQVAGVRPE